MFRCSADGRDFCVLKDVQAVYGTEVRWARDGANHSTAYGVKKKWSYNFTTPAHIWIYGVYMDSFIFSFTSVFKDANEVTNTS